MCAACTARTLRKYGDGPTIPSQSAPPHRSWLATFQTPACAFLLRRSSPNTGTPSGGRAQESICRTCPLKTQHTKPAPEFGPTIRDAHREFATPQGGRPRILKEKNGTPPSGGHLHPPHPLETLRALTPRRLSSRNSHTLLRSLRTLTPICHTQRQTHNCRSRLPRRFLSLLKYGARQSHRPPRPRNRSTPMGKPYPFSSLPSQSTSRSPPPHPRKIHRTLLPCLNTLNSHATSHSHTPRTPTAHFPRHVRLHTHPPRQLRNNHWKRGAHQTLPQPPCRRHYHSHRKGSPKPLSHNTRLRHQAHGHNNTHHRCAHKRPLTRRLLRCSNSSHPHCSQSSGTECARQIATTLPISLSVDGLRCRGLRQHTLPSSFPPQPTNWGRLTGKSRNCPPLSEGRHTCHRNMVWLCLPPPRPSLCFLKGSQTPGHPARTETTRRYLETPLLVAHLLKACPLEARSPFPAWNPEARPPCSAHRPEGTWGPTLEPQMHPKAVLRSRHSLWAAQP